METVPAGEHRNGTLTYILNLVIVMFRSGRKKAAGCPANSGPGRLPVINIGGAAFIVMSPLIFQPRVRGELAAYRHACAGGNPCGRSKAAVDHSAA